MKKVYVRSFFISLIAIVISSCASLKGAFGGYSDHYSTCFCYKGQWSSWDRHYFPTTSYGRESDNWRINSIHGPGNHIIGLELQDSGHNVYFRFKISNYEKGGKTFSGTVEYYVNDSYPTAEAMAKANHFVRPDYRSDLTPSVKRTTKATIKIVNDGNKPETFNIWFDNIGVGFDVQNVWFSDRFD